MAGGTGTRFWPASRAATPKQLLSLVGDKTMIRQTVDRLAGLIPPDNTLIVTNRRLVEPIAEQLPELPAASIVGEPCKRDTAPCIGLAALLVSRYDPDATMAVMPADHVIRATDKFQAAMTQAEEMVDSEPDRIITFGIRPTYPAEIFGYIEHGEMIPGGSLARLATMLRVFTKNQTLLPPRNTVDWADITGTPASSSGEPRRSSTPWRRGKLRRLPV